MTARLTVHTNERHGVLYLPNEAIKTVNGQSVVEVKTAKGKTETRNITVGLSGEINTEIIEGLEEGEIVVIPSKKGKAMGGPPKMF